MLKRKSIFTFSEEREFMIFCSIDILLWKWIWFSYSYARAWRKKTISCSSICCIIIYTLHVSVAFWIDIKLFQRLPHFLPYALYTKSLHFGFTTSFTIPLFLPIYSFPRSNHSFCTPYDWNPGALWILPVHTDVKLPDSPDRETSQNTNFVIKCLEKAWFILIYFNYYFTFPFSLNSAGTGESQLWNLHWVPAENRGFTRSNWQMSQRQPCYAQTHPYS